MQREHVCRTSRVTQWQPFQARARCCVGWFLPRVPHGSRCGQEVAHEAAHAGRSCSWTTRDVRFAGLSVVLKRKGYLQLLPLPVHLCFKLLRWVQYSPIPGYAGGEGLGCPLQSGLEKCPLASASRKIQICCFKSLPQYCLTPYSPTPSQSTFVFPPRSQHTCTRYLMFQIA